MTKMNRRSVAKLLGGLTFAAVAPSAALAQIAAPRVATGARPRVVIIGGGAGGGTLAHVLRRGSPEIDVILIEEQQRYTSCFFSNLYFGGFRTLESLTHDYTGLKSLGVTLVHERATAVDTRQKTVTLQNGTTVPYDRLVLSPGIELKYQAIPGYSVQAEQIMPHAYKAGPQTELLMRQLEAMPDGGTVVLAPPQNPYRCPPGPYERACMIGHYLKTRKPRSKLVILDPKKSFSKEGLFKEAFAKEYAGIIELHQTTDIDNFALKRVDPETMEIETVSGKKIKASVANIIPPQRAGQIAHLTGCAEGDWCPIKPESFASIKVPNVYVIGDSSIAGDMPKSAFSANSQSKAVSNEIEAELAGKPKYPARYRNTCWSMLGPGSSVKIGANYVAKDGKVTAVATFVSKSTEDYQTREKSFKESVGWYAGMVAEIFNKRVEHI